MFSRIFMQLVGEGREVHSVVVGREIIWQSDIIFTPYLDDNTIDAEAAGSVRGRRLYAGRRHRNEIDTGSIILTGEALKRTNARAIAELFAMDSGKFVCASAGHHLEAVLAANGSGTVARSRRDQRTLLTVDIGGARRSWRWCATARSWRQPPWPSARVCWSRTSRVGSPASTSRRDRSLSTSASSWRSAKRLPAEDEARIVATWVDVLAGLIELRTPEGIAAELMLTEPLPMDVVPQAITFSGGVSEFIFLRETRDFGDLGLPLAKAIRDAMSSGRIALPAIIDPDLGIRATAIGASLFTTQAGIHPYVSDESILPLRNVPVLIPRLDLEGDIAPAVVASAIREAALRADFEEGEQAVAPLLRVARRCGRGAGAPLSRQRHPRRPARTIEASVPVVLLVDYTISRALGRALKEDLGIPGDVISMEGVTVADYDFIDVTEVLHPAEVVPVSISRCYSRAGSTAQRQGGAVGGCKVDEQAVARPLRSAANTT